MYTILRYIIIMDKITSGHNIIIIIQSRSTRRVSNRTFFSERIHIVCLFVLFPLARHTSHVIHIIRTSESGRFNRQRFNTYTFRTGYPQKTATMPPQWYICLNRQKRTNRRFYCLREVGDFKYIFTKRPQREYKKKQVDRLFDGKYKN